MKYRATSVGDRNNIFRQIGEIVNAISITANVTQKTLTSTKTGSNIAHLISNSKLLKPITYARIVINTPLDLYLSANGQQSWTKTGLNFTISISAIAIGGWYGIGLQGFYFFGEAGYNMTMKGLEQGIIKPNSNLTRNYIPGLAPSPVIGNY